MKLTAKAIPYSGVFGGGLGLIDQTGAAQFQIVFMGASHGISIEQRDALQRQIGALINAYDLTVPEHQT